jgi:AraC family transcriptional regulator
VSQATEAEESYRERFRRALAYADVHLSEELTLEQLSRIAAFSKFHFHRQFAALFGLSLYEYVRLARLKRAAHELAFRTWRSVLEVALDSGYESPEAFARAFKKRVGQTPSEFRSQPDWTASDAAFEAARTLRRQHMTQRHSVDDVEIVNFPGVRVAALEHHGAPERVGDSVRKFIEWRKKTGLVPRVSATFNVSACDPETTAPEAYQLDLCAATDGEIIDHGYGIVEKRIPAGRCAKLRHTGTEDLLRQSVHFLYLTWLPKSGEEPREFPLFLQRVKFFPDVPEHEAIVDIYLPLVG